LIHKNNNDKKGKQLRVVLRLYVRVALQQKTANFKVAFFRRIMQRSFLTEKTIESEQTDS
jgi:hypothetical protein